MSGEIVLPRRSITDVHELIYLFESWKLVFEADLVPEPLDALKDLPPHLETAMTEALTMARAQLQSAQTGTEIALRLPATPEFAELMRWGSERLEAFGSELGAAGDATWERALRLANDFVASALEQLGEVRQRD